MVLKLNEFYFNLNVDRLITGLINMRLEDSPSQRNSGGIHHRAGGGEGLISPFLEVTVDVSCRSKYPRVQLIWVRRNDR